MPAVPFDGASRPKSGRLDTSLPFCDPPSSALHVTRGGDRNVRSNSPQSPTSRAALQIPPVAWLLTFVSCAALLAFMRLGVPLQEPQESRYAEIPRQMLAEGKWLVPVLHGEPYLDKPPLLYWLVMGFYSVFGVHDWAARIVPCSAAFLTMLVTYLWG